MFFSEVPIGLYILPQFIGQASWAFFHHFDLVDYKVAKKSLISPLTVLFFSPSLSSWREGALSIFIQQI